MEYPGLDQLNPVWKKEWGNLDEELKEYLQEKGPVQLFGPDKRVSADQMRHLDYHRWTPMSLGSKVGGYASW